MRTKAFFALVLAAALALGFLLPTPKPEAASARSQVATLVLDD